MNDKVKSWLAGVVREREFEGPVVEFGSLQTPGQVEYADLRGFFPGLEFIGCDIRRGPGVDLVDDMERSTFGPGEVGTVLCLETLEHVKHPWLAVREAYRILRPGGQILVSIPFRFPVHAYPDDYWRMTPSALAVLLEGAGFEHIETSDSGEECDWNREWDASGEVPSREHFPYHSYAVAWKPDEPAEAPRGRAIPHSTTGSCPESADVRRSSRSEQTGSADRAGGRVAIVVPVYHREEITRRMLEQLGEVTDDYSLVIVNNGFDDPAFLHSLNPIAYVENTENTGAIHPINQGLELAQGRYVAVLHNDLMIYDHGWLDRIIEFMERRHDVGLVGLAGRHSIKEDGSADWETTVVDIRDYPLSHRPRWRITEVATIDGLGWVMRNVGLRLEEDYGLMHFYDLDLSLQYIEAGYRVYAASVEIDHLARDETVSTRNRNDYLDEVGGDDEEYYDEVREKFRRKWRHLLPITRGFQDEVSAYHRIDELHRELDEAREFLDGVEEYVRLIEGENRRRGEEIARASEYARKVECDYRRRVAEVEELDRQVRELRAASAGRVSSLGAPGVRPDSLLARFERHRREDGLPAALALAGRRLIRKQYGRGG